MNKNNVENNNGTGLLLAWFITFALYTVNTQNVIDLGNLGAKGIRKGINKIKSKKKSDKKESDDN